MTTFTESFPGADQAALAGDLTWTEVNGNWERKSNKASNVSTAGLVAARAEHDVSSADHYVQAVLDQPQDSTARGGVCARYAAGGSTYYVFWVRNNASVTYRIAKVSAGTLTALQSVSTTPPGFPATIKITVSGTTIKGFVGGVEVISATDASITTGARGGLFVEGADAANDVYLDSFEIGDLGASVPSGTSAGTWAWVGAAAGTRVSKATTAGTFAYVGAASGTRVSKATAAGTFAYVGAASGTTVNSGTAAGTFAYVGTAAGSAPGVGAAEGSGSGTWTYAGLAAGAATQQGAAAGTFAYIGAAVGGTTHRGTGAGTWAYVGEASGSAASLVWITPRPDTGVSARPSGGTTARPRTYS